MIDDKGETAIKDTRGISQQSSSRYLRIKGESVHTVCGKM